MDRRPDLAPAMMASTRAIWGWKRYMNASAQRRLSCPATSATAVTLGRVHAGGLFGQHMLAGAQGGDGQGRVGRMGGGDVDGIDPRIGQQGVNGRVHLGTEARRKGRRAGRIAAGDCQQAARRLFPTGGREVARDAARPDDAPVDCHACPPCFARRLAGGGALARGVRRGPAAHTPSPRGGSGRRPRSYSCRSADRSPRRPFRSASIAGSLPVLPA